MRKDREAKTPIDDYEYNKLLALYRERTDPNRRAPERVDRPIVIKPAVAGGRIVNWPEYLDMVERGAAQYPPSKNK